MFFFYVCDHQLKSSQLQISQCLFIKSCTNQATLISFIKKITVKKFPVHNRQLKQKVLESVTFVDDQLFQFSFSSCSFHNFLINSVCCNKTIYNNWLCLTNSVTSILGLKIRLGVLKVKKKNNI